MAARIIIFICFAALLGVPFLFRPPAAAPPSGAGAAEAGDALTLIAITPHNEQIRYEFAHAFDAWHQRHHGQPVNVIYNVPGGTTEIRKLLESQFTAALEDGRPPGGDADLVFGGGSFEHGRLKRGVRIVNADGIDRWEPISAQIDFDEAWLNEIYGENKIGDGILYDSDRYWFGVALSGFGIVYNRDVLATLGVPEPVAWSDLCDPRLRGWVALVNPGQSGSITTAFEAILKRSGWIEGWQILRRAAANARYFSASSLKPPTDVSQGNAALGVCIDFYGRYAAQTLKEAGDADRVGYVDPPEGATTDADPISVLRNAPHPEVAKRFIEFALSDEGQALWQFHAVARLSEPVGVDASQVSPSETVPARRAGLPNPPGPLKYELRRLPIRRAMYEQHMDRMIDQVNPFDLSTPVEHPDPNFRDFIAPLFAAMAMDTHEELQAAWKAIVRHPAYPPADGIATARDVTDPTLRRMLELFDEMPSIEGAGGVNYALSDVASLGPVRNGWLRGGWKDAGLWDREASPVDVMRQRFGAFFRANYREIVEMAK